MGAIELLYIKFMRKEQTSLPALVFTGTSRNSVELLRITKDCFGIITDYKISLRITKDY